MLAWYIAANISIFKGVRGITVSRLKSHSVQHHKNTYARCSILETINHYISKTLLMDISIYDENNIRFKFVIRPAWSNIL